MTHIPIMVKVVNEIMPAGEIDVEGPTIGGKITSCFNCGGIVLYERTCRVEGTEYATDTEVYCAQCGDLVHGMFNDPLDELDECMKPRSLSGKVKDDEN